MSSQAQKGERFRALHAGPPFVIPNPWDAGSARMLEAAGFRALATTSSGLAFTLGRLDGDVTLDAVIAHVRTLVRSTDLPVSVDLENGYGRDPKRVAMAIAGVADAGAVGASIEDYDRAAGIYSISLATERVAAAIEAAAVLGFAFTLTARAENHIRGNPDIRDTVARLRAFEAAGADVVYAPGLRTVDAIHEVCAAVTAPVNVLALGGLSFAEMTGAGAQRVSLGGGLAWVAVEAAASVAATIRDSGDFSGLRATPPLRNWFA